MLASQIRCFDVLLIWTAIQFPALLFRSVVWVVDASGTNDYGIDVSFPMTKDRIETPNILGDRQGLYDELLEGCAQAYDRERCHRSEQRRIQRNKHQPFVLKNFTQQGFAKIQTPTKLWSLVEQFWIDNSASEHWSLEDFEHSESEFNNWQAPTYLVSLWNETFHGGGSDLETAIWNSAKDTLEEWTGQKLLGCSLWGIRIYTEGSILHTHVDRIPLIASAILNVAQDTDEPWPLEVIGHDGKAHNISMVPGDMILYESHTILHGRPFPLKGRYMANIFVHFEVIDQNGGDVLPYVNYDRVSPKEYQNILQEHSDHWGAHHLARSGELERLQLLVENNSRVIHSTDGNGWTPLHEAARGGHIEVVQYLLSKGAKLNQPTKDGGTPLHYAAKFQGDESTVYQFLKEVDAVQLGQEL